MCFRASRILVEHTTVMISLNASFAKRNTQERKKLQSVAFAADSAEILLDFVHELDVVLQLPAHHGQQLLIFLLQVHHGHTAVEKLGDKHPGSAAEVVKIKKSHQGNLDNIRKITCGNNGKCGLY